MQTRVIFVEPLIPGNLMGISHNKSTSKIPGAIRSGVGVVE